MLIRPYRDADQQAVIALWREVLPDSIEETFPLACSTAELEEFIKRSRRTACGWMGHYDGMTPERLEALKKEKPLTMAQALYLEWLQLFRKLKSE